MTAPGWAIPPLSAALSAALHDVLLTRQEYQAIADWLGRLRRPVNRGDQPHRLDRRARPGTRPRLRQRAHPPLPPANPLRVPFGHRMLFGSRGASSGTRCRNRTRPWRGLAVALFAKRAIRPRKNEGDGGGVAVPVAGRDGRTPYLGGAGNPVLGARGVNPRTVIG
jgi:hypothetical protein